MPKTVGQHVGESFGGADFIGLGKWSARQRVLNSSGGLTVEKQQVRFRRNPKSFLNSSCDLTVERQQVGSRSTVVVRV